MEVANEEECGEVVDDEDISLFKPDKIHAPLKGLIQTNKFKTGVVYLSFVPPYMTADTLRRMLSKFAPVGRIFIQVVQETGERKIRRSKEDTIYEAWVEFLKKRHAKEVAGLINNTKMGGKKKSRFYDCLWNVKYLPRFKWVHLTERLNYEKAAMKQKLRAEISQAKRVAYHFKEAVEKQELNNKKNRKKGELNEIMVEEIPTLQLNERFKQKETKQLQNKINLEQKRENFLMSLFS